MTWYFALLAVAGFVVLAVLTWLLLGDHEGKYTQLDEDEPFS